jgi:hypothetical protein
MGKLSFSLFCQAGAICSPAKTGNDNTNNHAVIKIAQTKLN